MKAFGILVNELHLSNVQEPIKVTEIGISIFSREFAAIKGKWSYFLQIRRTFKCNLL